MPRRECTVQDSLESYPKRHSIPNLCPTAWSSLVWKAASWENVWGSSANSCLWLL